MKKTFLMTCAALGLAVGGVFAGWAAPVPPPPAGLQPPPPPESVQMAVGQTIQVGANSRLVRVSVGNPEVVDVATVKGSSVFLVGKSVGTSNVYLWDRSGGTRTISVSVSVDVAGIRAKLLELLPNENDLRVVPAGSSYVLTGTVSSEVAARQAELIARQYGKQIINMLGTRDVSQVLLEVRVAEIEKTLDDKMGASFTSNNSKGAAATATLGFLSGSAGTISLGKGISNLTLDAEVNDGRARILAEPNIVAISGQEASFLAGGKIYIPIPQYAGPGLVEPMLQEEDYGVGLRFTPTVLENGRINLRVTPEVSELLTTGTTFGTGGNVTVVPTITTRRASTTVQLNDGQTFAIGGLIQNNVTEAVKAFPILGEIPVLGALFRSSEFQADRSELVFVITPHLVKAVNQPVPMPTDHFATPSRAEFQLEGKMEGAPEKKQDNTIPSTGGVAPQPAGGTAR